MRKWIIRVVLATLVLMVAAIGFVTLAGTRAGPLPDVAPGYRVMPIAAAHRPEGLSLHLWYPATAGAVALIGQNALFYGFHARPDAAGDGVAHPVIVLSHGSGGNAERLGWIGASLARAGYIVAAVNHPGTTSQDSLPARTVMPWERAADVTALLDALSMSSPSGVVPDMNRVGALGFLLGGATALQVSGARLSKEAFIAYCTANAGFDDCGWLAEGGVDFNAIDQARYEQDNRDARIRAVAAIDPALSDAMTPQSLAGVPPTLIVNLGAGAEIPAAMRADDLVTQIPDATYLEIAGARHFSFLARCSLFGVVMIGVAGEDNICSDRGLRDRDEVHAEVVDAVIRFFGSSL